MFVIDIVGQRRKYESMEYSFECGACGVRFTNERDLDLISENATRHVRRGHNVAEHRIQTNVTVARQPNVRTIGVETYSDVRVNRRSDEYDKPAMTTCMYCFCSVERRFLADHRRKMHPVSSLLTEESEDDKDYQICPECRAVVSTDMLELHANTLHRRRQSPRSPFYRG